MNHDDMLAYVRHAARLARLVLDDAQAARVAMHLSRTQALALALSELPLAPHVEPAEAFRPAPFPEADA